jgi:DNA end-binding protein Ku
MRAIKTTSLSCGLLNVPVKLYKAVESHDFSFKLYHAGCGGSIGMLRVCKDCEGEVEWADVAKGAEAADGTLVIAAPEEIKALEGEQVPAVEVLHFMGADEVDPVSYESAYYLAPDKAGVKGYALLHEALSETKKVALVKFALRGRESLGVLRVSGDVLVTHTIAWPDEIREPQFAILEKPVKLKPKESELARALVESMTEPFVAEDHVDVYTGRVEEFIETKAAGGEFVAHPAGPEPAVDDLLAALEATIAKKKKKTA